MTITSMTHRERALAAMRGKPTDRPACLPLVDTSYAAAIAGIPVDECFLNPEAYAEALVATLKRHPDLDGVSINIGLCDDVIEKQWHERGSKYARTAGGITWMIPENDIGSVHSCEIKEFDDARFETADYLMQACVRTLKAIPEDIRREYLINTTVTGPFSQAAFMVGLNEIMMGTLEDPDALISAVEKRVAFAFRWVDALKELDPGSIWIGEGFASNSLLSTESYRQFVQPYEKQVVDYVHETIGCPVVIHICGKLHQTLEAIADTGADCAEIDWQLDLADAAQRVGDRLALKGNLNTSFLCSATPEEVLSQSLERLAAGAPCGRYILSSGCCLGRDTPPENIDAMIEACKTFSESNG